MKYNKVKKIIMIGFIILFIGAGVGSSAYGEIKSKEIDNNENFPISENYIETYKNKLIWDDGNLRFENGITKSGTEPENWASILDEIRLRNYESGLNETETPPKNIIEINPRNINLEHKIPSVLGWVIYNEFVNPWADKWTDISENGKYAEMSASTGEGACGAPASISGPGYAQAGIYYAQQGYGYKWNGDNTNGILVLKDPSHIKGGITNFGNGAAASVIILIEQWYNGEKEDSYVEAVYRQAGTGSFNFDDSLDDLGIEFQLKTGRIYVIKTWASAYGHCGPTPEQISYTDISSVKFKKVWWLYEVEDDPTINLIEPEGIWFFGRKYRSGYPIAILIICPGISCIAETTGYVDHVTITFMDKSVPDYEPSDNIWTGVIKGASGFGTLYARAYDSNNNLLDTDSVRMLKFGGS